MSTDSPPPLDAPHPAEVEDCEAFAPGPIFVAPPDPRREPVKPPHSLEAEREVLSAVLIDGRAIVDLVENLTASSFYFERHQAVFACMVELASRGVSIDVVTLQQALKDRGHFERVGGTRTLGELIDRAGTVSNLGHYIGIVRDKARLRHVIDTAHAIEGEARGDVDDVDAFVAQVEARWAHTLGQVAKVPEVMALPSIADRKAQGVDWLGTPPPEAKLLLRTPDGKPFMRMQRVGAIVAPGGTGKTFALLDLALSVATGKRWLETYQVERHGRVFIGLGEEDDEEIRRRTWEICQRFSDNEHATVEENVFPMGLMGRRVGLMERGPDGNTIASPWYRQLRETLERNGPWRLIILDPWSRWGGPDAETDAHAATIGVSLLESLLQLPGEPAVIVAHHTRKQAAGYHGAEASDARGNSAFTDGVRWQANLTKRGKAKLLQLEVTKTNNTVPGLPLALVRGKGGVLRPATPVEIAEADEAEQGAKKGKRVARLDNTL